MPTLTGLSSRPHVSARPTALMSRHASRPVARLVAGLASRRARPRASATSRASRASTSSRGPLRTASASTAPATRDAPRLDGRARATTRRRARDALRAEAAAGTVAGAVLGDRRPSTRSTPRGTRALRRLARYADWGDRRVKGFFEPGLLRVYLALDEMHERRGVSGALAEIGVFHGKSFIPLALLAAPGERAVAVDCFADQTANRDGSGEGCRAAFERNLSDALDACCRREEEEEEEAEEAEEEEEGEGDDGEDAATAATPRLARRPPLPAWVSIVEADSTTLSGLADVPDGGCRVVSVDGCHTAAATAADLALAHAALHPEGVVVLDDAFNPDWPGVVTGLFEWSAESGRALRPFALAYGKAFLARPGAARERYFRRLAPGARKTATFMGEEVAVYPHGWISAFHGNE